MKRSHEPRLIPRRRPEVLRDNREATAALNRLAGFIPGMVAAEPQPIAKPRFNPTGDIEQPGRIRCGACGDEVEGDDALHTMMLLAAHLRSVNDDAHRKQLAWLREKVLQSEIFKGVRREP